MSTFEAIREQQVNVDYNLYRLTEGKTRYKRSKTSNCELHDLCAKFSNFEGVLEYLFKVAKIFGQVFQNCLFQQSDDRTFVMLSIIKT